MILVVFLPAYTQVRDTVVKSDSTRLSPKDSAELERIKSNIVIDSSLIRLKLNNMKSDTLKKIKDTLKIK